MPLTIEQEGLLNELAQQIKAIHQIDVTEYNDDITRHPDVKAALQHLTPLWRYIHFDELMRVGVVQHEKTWSCERPLENLIKAIAQTKFTDEQKANFFFNALTDPTHPLTEQQRQAVLSTIAQYSIAH